MVVPWTAGGAYHELGLSSIQLLIGDALDQLIADNPPVSADLPDSVELTVQRSGSPLVVHLMNLSGRRRKNFGPWLPISGGMLTIRGGRSARALVAQQSCEISGDGELLTVSLPSLGEFEVIVIDDWMS